MKIKFIEDNGKIDEFSLEFITKTSTISKIKDSGKAEFFMNIWFRNGKRHLLRSYDKTKLLLFKSKLWFQHNKEQISNELQAKLS